MALTYSSPAEIGKTCPDFRLKGVDGQLYELSQFNSSTVLAIAFICGHCPYVLAIEDRLLAVSKKWPVKKVQWVGICSNDSTEHPEDRPEQLKIRSELKNYSFPYLIDDQQIVAKKMGAICTPDFFVFDDQRRLYYRGRLDDSWRDPQKVRRLELVHAIESALSGERPPKEQTPSMGCSIKWKHVK
jgi:peroxiredoxin